MNEEARRRIATYYDEWDSYESDWRRSDLTTAVVADWLAHNVEPGHRVLDVGCGPGQFTRGLPGDVTVCGTDISPGMLQRARASRPAGTYRLHSYDKRLPPDLGLFDRVIAIGCLEFCSDLALVLGNLRAALDRGGRLLANIAERRPQSDAVVWIESLAAGQYAYAREEVEAAAGAAGLIVRAATPHGAYRNYKTGDIPPYVFWDLAPGDEG